MQMGQFGHAWSISPDRQRLVAAAGVRRKGEPTAVRFVDLASRRIEGTVTLPGEFSRVTATAWIRGRVLVVVSASSATRVYAVDPDRRVTISQIEFPGTVVLGERAQSSLVLLLAAPNQIGPATIAVVDQSPRVRTVVLEKIAVGTTTTGDGAERRFTIRRPALTLGPSGQRAFVIGAGEPPAAIDLRTLSVRYAPVRLTAAANKQVEGSIRTAETLPDGRIVVGANVYGATAAENTAGLWLSTPRTGRVECSARNGPGSASPAGSSSPEAKQASASGSSNHQAQPANSSAPDPSPASPSSGRERSSPSSARTSKRPSSSSAPAASSDTPSPPTHWSVPDNRSPAEPASRVSDALTEDLADLA